MKITLLVHDQQWKRQLNNAFKSPLALLEYLGIDPQAQSIVGGKPLLKGNDFAMLVPQYFADLMVKGNINDPLLLQVLPFSNEQVQHPDFVDQPLAEQDKFIPIQNIVHKYNDRLLFLPKGSCAVNCRYCFRRNFPYEELGASKEQWKESLNYAFKQQVSELILSGGDPLMMNDKEFAWLLQEVVDHNLHMIESRGKQINRIRIHSRLLVVLPERITAAFLDLCKQAKKVHINLVLVTHINHPQEIAQPFAIKIQALREAGVTLLNQNVLLRGVNDQLEVLIDLSQKLFAIGILPYYLFLLDKVTGATHFYVPDEQALKLYRQLQESTSGYLVPKLAREEVGHKHKTLYGQV